MNQERPPILTSCVQFNIRSTDICRPTLLRIAMRPSNPRPVSLKFRLLTIVRLLLLTFFVSISARADVRHEPGNLDYSLEGKYPAAISKQAHGEANVSILETRGNVSLFKITSSSE